MTMLPSTIMGINQLPLDEKREVYTRLIPPLLVERLKINPSFITDEGIDLFTLKAVPGSSNVEMALYHKPGFPDPVLYGHLTDTLIGQTHILLYALADPASPRYDVDRLADGRSTVFGTRYRNLEAEEAAMQAGLAPGQIRRGLRMLSQAILGFEKLIASLQHDLYFVEPLYYHNAVIFERYGFAYQQGRQLMEEIEIGFNPGGNLISRLDGSTSFRHPEAAASCRLRSWAIHDGILGEAFTNVTMYKRLGISANVFTCPNLRW